MKPFIEAADVAQLTGFQNATAFLRARPRLEDEGFPLPMPTSLRPLLWRREQVEAWIDVQGVPRNQRIDLTSLRDAGPNVILMAEARRA